MCKNNTIQSDKQNLKQEKQNKSSKITNIIYWIISRIIAQNVVSNYAFAIINTRLDYHHYHWKLTDSRHAFRRQIINLIGRRHQYYREGEISQRQEAMPQGREDLYIAVGQYDDE